MEIKDGRHPVVEQISIDKMFIPNDLILSIFEKVPRESFIQQDLKSIAYHDGDIEIKDGRWLLSSHKLAKFISCLEYSQNDVILEIVSLIA